MASALRNMFSNETHKSMLDRYNACHRKNIAANVSLTRIPCTQDIAVRYHYTNIVTFHEDDTITLNNGGHFTSSTKAHMCAILSGIAIVSQKEWTWYVSCEEGNIPYENGMRITTTNTKVLSN